MRKRLALFLAALVLVALALGALYAISLRRQDAAKREQTTLTLTQLTRLVLEHDLGRLPTDLPPPRATGDARDPTGMIALHEYLMGGHYLLNSEPGTLGSKFLNGELEKDAWGRPIVYRCPGVLHTKGFDFHSFGPDGRDDKGAGDDLVEGATKDTGW